MKKTILLLAAVVILFTGSTKAVVFASETVATVHWKISNLTDMHNHSMNLEMPILAMDVDFGKTFLHVYGAFSSEDGLKASIASGTGAFYQGSESEIWIDVRSNAKLYKLKLKADTLSGTCAIYDHAGSIEALGSIDLISVYQ